MLTLRMVLTCMWARMLVACCITELLALESWLFAVWWVKELRCLSGSLYRMATDVFSMPRLLLVYDWINDARWEETQKHFAGRASRQHSWSSAGLSWVTVSLCTDSWSVALSLRSSIESSTVQQGALVADAKLCQRTVCTWSPCLATSAGLVAWLISAWAIILRFAFLERLDLAPGRFACALFPWWHTHRARPKGVPTWVQLSPTLLGWHCLAECAAGWRRSPNRQDNRGLIASVHQNWKRQWQLFPTDIFLQRTGTNNLGGNDKRLPTNDCVKLASRTGESVTLLFQHSSNRFLCGNGTETVGRRDRPLPNYKTWACGGVLSSCGTQEFGDFSWMRPWLAQCFHPEQFISRLCLFRIIPRLFLSRGCPTFAYFFTSLSIEVWVVTAFSSCSGASSQLSPASSCLVQMSACTKANLFATLVPICSHRLAFCSCATWPWRLRAACAFVDRLAKDGSKMSTRSVLLFIPVCATRFVTCSAPIRSWMCEIAPQKLSSWNRLSPRNLPSREANTLQFERCVQRESDHHKDEVLGVSLLPPVQSGFVSVFAGSWLS